MEKPLVLTGYKSLGNMSNIETHNPSEGVMVTEHQRILKAITPGVLVSPESHCVHPTHVGKGNEES